MPSRAEQTSVCQARAQELARSFNMRAAAAFNAAKFEELPPDFELVAPGVARGSLLAFDYRVLHAGNPCARHRPVACFVVNTRDDAVDDPRLHNYGRHAPDL